jgi:hypothetical protein
MYEKIVVMIKKEEGQYIEGQAPVKVCNNLK